MLWHKAWVDTRWRFLIGLGVLIASALACVFGYRYVQEILAANSKGPLPAEISSVAELSNSFRGYVWIQFVRQNLLQLWTVFAVLFGAEGLISQRRGALFMLSLPVSRRRLCAVRAATDLAELCVLALIPMLLISLAAPAAGHSYALADAVVHGIGIFAGGAVFYCLALLLATAFVDRWRPIVISLALAVLLYLGTRLMPALAPFGPVSVMAGDTYFRTGAPAWAALSAWLLCSAALLYLAVRQIVERDY
jgi:ABC-type transport system involved in multi-copper enzyme maturation permease subunit